MPHAIWLAARQQLRGELLEKDFETWIEPLRPARWSGGVLTLEAPSAFARDWLKQRFMAMLERALADVSGGPAGVVLMVNRSLDVPAGRHARPARRAGVPTGPPARYTFEDFVVGASNRLAHGAARTVVAQPGARFNPLFIYGSCGLGKTHLANAIANALAVDRPAGTVACVSAENFVNAMILAIQGRSMERFRQRFRGIQMLVVDDVHFLAEKRRSQEEFCHTFNALHQGSRQIVLTSDRAPHAVPGIEEALRDRFAAGLLAEIEAPDAELRLALVTSKASALGLALSPEILAYLAEGWCTNVRVLEGAITRLEAYATLAGRAITLALAHEALGPAPATRNGAPTVESIIGEVCRQYKLSRAEIGSARRTARLAVPRQLAMYLCRQHTDVALHRIGAELGGRDHSTVLHALAAIERRLATDAALRDTVSALRARLRA